MTTNIAHRNGNPARDTIAHCCVKKLVGRRRFSAKCSLIPNHGQRRFQNRVNSWIDLNIGALIVDLNSRRSMVAKQIYLAFSLKPKAQQYAEREHFETKAMRYLMEHGRQVVALLRSENQWLNRSR